MNEIPDRPSVEDIRLAKYESEMDDLLVCSICGACHFETRGSCPLCGTSIFNQGHPDIPTKEMLIKAFTTYVKFHEMAAIKYRKRIEELSD